MNKFSSITESTKAMTTSFDPAIHASIGHERDTSSVETTLSNSINEPTDVFNLIDAHHLKGERGQADKVLRWFVEEAGSDEEIDELIEIYKSKGDYVQVEKILELQIGERCVGAVRDLAEIYKSTGKDTKAQQMLVKFAASNDGADIDALVITYTSCGDYQQAEKILSALTCNEQAVKFGNKDVAAAIHHLGTRFHNGVGVPQDYAMAVTCYQCALKLGAKQAACNLGCIYLDGYGTNQPNVEEAIKCFTQAGPNDGSALFNLAQIYHYGRGNVPSNRQKAIDYYKLAAGFGVALAWFPLGEINQKSGNYQEALNCFKQSADLGNMEALISLAGMHMTGYGSILPNPQLAFECWQLAANKGNSKAIYNIAKSYCFAFGPYPQDYKMAIQLYKQAGELGCKEAVCSLGALCYSGYGDVPPNHDEAINYWKQAIDMGDTESLYCLATVFHLRGDWGKAIDYYTKAGEAGNAAALFQLGELSRLGYGTTKPNNQEAIKYFKRSAVLGYEAAKKVLRDTLSIFLTSKSAKL